MTFTVELRPYQIEAQDLALAALRQHGGFAFFLEQRTGKTPLSCSIIEILQPTRLLITCPEIAVLVWEEHLERYGLNEGREIRIITRDSLWRERKRLRRWKPQLVIADEGHDFKGKNSKRSRALRIISRVAKYRLLLTGTPQESGLEDYWAQFDFVDQKLFGTWGDFKRQYLVYGGFRNKKIVGYENETGFRHLLRQRSFRVLLEDVQEIKTNIEPVNIVRFDLNDSLKAYREMEESLMLDLNAVVRVKKLRPDGSSHFVSQRKRLVAPRAITQAMKLHQLSGGFIHDGDRIHRFGDEKLTQAGALMLVLGDAPQVYFVRFIAELHRLGKLFSILGRTVTYISGQHKNYVSGTPFDIAVVQIQSGVSIDLAHAEEAIMYSWNYSHLTHDQAKFRIRSYHGRRVRYHYLVGNDTIDEQLLEVAVRKASFAKLIIDKYRRK